MKIHKIYGIEKPDEETLEKILKKSPRLQARKFYKYALQQSFNVKDEKEYFNKIGALLFKLCENEEFTKYYNLIRSEMGKRLQNNIEYPSIFITLMRPR